MTSVETLQVKAEREGSRGEVGVVGVWARGEATNLGSCPVDPAFGTGVNVDQHEPLHQGGVVQLQKGARRQQQNENLSRHRPKRALDTTMLCSAQILISS